MPIVGEGQIYMWKNNWQILKIFSIVNDAVCKTMWPTIQSYKDQVISCCNPWLTVHLESNSRWKTCKGTLFCKTGPLVKYILGRILINLDSYIFPHIEKT